MTTPDPNPRRIHLVPPKLEPTVPPLAPPTAPMRDQIISALRRIFDPEIPVSIWDLGLIYRLDIDESVGKIAIDMTLTTPNCPEAESIPALVRQHVAAVPGVADVQVRLIWDPPWDKSRMSEDARLALGLE